MTTKNTEALKSVYRKHILGDDLIGLDELTDIVYSALADTLGDEEFQRWVEEVKK